MEGRVNPLELSPFLSISQTQAYMNISHSHLYRIMGELDVRKVGNKTLIHKASIDKYMDGCRKVFPPPKPKRPMGRPRKAA